ncbi:hypothetical protein PWT90_10938 [Aphanocladium album]|nr:hypothetical protein PWT90_10938 [Aphanocladium album]
MASLTLAQGQPAPVSIQSDEPKNVEIALSTAADSKHNELTTTPVHEYLYTMIEIGVVRTLAERGVFSAIPITGDISVQELAEKTSIDLALLDRFTKFLILAKVLVSQATGRVAHTAKSQFFSIPRAIDFLSLHVDFFMGPATRWPDYFEANGFKEPQSGKQTPLGLYHGYPEKSIYEVMPLLPGNKASIFNRAMANTLDSMPILGYYDFSWIPKHACIEADPKRTLLVDVGGGKGQAIKAILEENPTIPCGRCVLQDQAFMINEAIAEDDVVVRQTAKVVSSFFEPQLVKGALVYHIRRVLNDWSDKEAIEILQHVRDACVADSVVLVSEQLLPDEPSLDLAAMDVFIINYGGKRRTRAMFEKLAGAAGLKVVSVSVDKATGQAMIEMVPA